MRWKDSFLLQDPDKVLAIAGVAFSLMLILYLGKEIGRVPYLLTGVLALVACLLWLAIRKSHLFESFLPESPRQLHLMSSCFFGLYILSVLSVYLRPNLYERPLLYFVLSALMAGIIACEIFTSGRQHVRLVLVQIVLLGASIVWSQVLIFPSLIGVDPWYHSAVTTRILDLGYIPDGTAYSNLPIFHLVIAVTSLVTDLPYKYAVMVSVSFAQILCIALFVFLLTSHLLSDHRLGLLSALMVMIANHQVWLSYWSIPNGFGAVFIPVALYLLFFRYRDTSHSQLPIIVILALLSGTIILTHTLTATFMAILLLIAWTVLRLNRIVSPKAEKLVLATIPVGFIVAMFGWWTYGSHSLRTLGGFIAEEFGADYLLADTPAAYLRYAIETPLAEQLFNISGVFLFFAFSFIGIFYMISRRGSVLTFSMALMGAAPLAIGFFALITGLSVINQRWFFFAQVLLSIPLAIAIYAVGTWKIKEPAPFFCYIFGFVAVLCFIMIMSGMANVDNTTFTSNTRWRAAVTEGEQGAITTLTDKWDGPLKTDQYFADTQKFRYPQVSSFSEMLNDDDFQALNDPVVLVRDEIVSHPFKIYSGLYRLDYDLNERLDNLGFSRIFDSSSGSGYRM